MTDKAILNDRVSQQPEGLQFDLLTEGVLSNDKQERTPAALGADWERAANAGNLDARISLFNKVGSEIIDGAKKAYSDKGVSGLADFQQKINKVINGPQGVHLEISGDKLTLRHVFDVTGQQERYEHLKPYKLNGLRNVVIDLHPPKTVDLQQAEKQPGGDMKGIAAAIIDDLQRFGGRKSLKDLMEKIAEQTEPGTRQSMEAALNEGLKGSALSIKLTYRDGLPGIHLPDSVKEKTVTITRSDDFEVAKILRQFDTVKGIGPNAGLKNEDYGVIVTKK